MGPVTAGSVMSLLQSIPKQEWDSLLRPRDSPFLEHDWIYAMEESECATVDTGMHTRRHQFYQHSLIDRFAEYCSDLKDRCYPSLVLH